MFCLPNVGVGCGMDMLRDGSVASETVFVEDSDRYNGLLNTGGPSG